LVLIFGVISSFSSSEPVELSTSWFDYLLIIIFSGLTYFLIFFKLEIDQPLKTIISLVSAFLVLLTSLITILPESGKLPEIRLKLPQVKKINFKLVGFVVLLVFVFLLGRFQFFGIFSPKLAPADPEMNIKVLNCSVDEDIGGLIAQKITRAGFTKTFFGPAKSKDCDNVTIYFSADHQSQAQIILKILEPYYTSVTSLPSDNPEAKEITIILGNRTLIE